MCLVKIFCANFTFGFLGRWVPSANINNNPLFIPVPPQHLLNEFDAEQLYVQKVGGLFRGADIGSTAGRDRLEGHPNLQRLRDVEYQRRVIPLLDINVRKFFGFDAAAQVFDHHRLAYVFGTVVNWNVYPFHSLVLCHIDLSHRIRQTHLG